MEEKFFVLANIYAPKNEDPTFLKLILDHLEDFKGSLRNVSLVATNERGKSLL